jgi:hypothetical protein
MEKTKLQKIEESYLGIFKFVLLLALSVSLLATVTLLAIGGSRFLDKPEKPVPEKEPPKVEINLDKFIQQLTPNEKTQIEESPPKRNEAEIALDKMVNLYVGKLWIHFDSYQKQCEAPVMVDRETFEKSFPKIIMRSWFKSYGQEFAESQDKFASAVINNPKAIQICKDRKGRGGVFTSLLDWHRDEWVRQSSSIQKFKSDERERVSQFNRSEELRIAAKMAEGTMLFWAALIAFGTFMSIAMLLIFSKIETNLRNLKQ